MSIASRPGRAPHNVRGLLLELGIGDFNATAIIRFGFWSPHQTDPDMPAIIILTRRIQENLRRMGATIAISGALDQPTDFYLRRLCGEGYLNRPWYQVMEAIVSAKNRDTRLPPVNIATENIIDPTIQTQAVAGFGFLPDVPGGVITYGLGAAALWYLLKKRK